MTRPPRLPRRPALPRQQLSPQDIFSPGGLDGGDRDSGWPQVLVVDDQQPSELLIGRARLQRHLRFVPDRTIAAYRVSPKNDDFRQQISELDGWTTMATFGAGISALHESGMPLSQIQASVRGAGHISDLGRIISVFRDNPNLFELADSSRGKLKLGHLQALARASGDQREALGREVLARRWPVQTLLRRISRPAAAVDADIQTLASELGQALGTEAQISGTAETGEVRLAWHSVEQLQGLFQRLSRSHTGGGGLPYPAPNALAPEQTKRWLTIRFVSALEFDDLFSHLLSPDSGFSSHGVQSWPAN